MAETGKVKSIRALFEKNVAKPKSPVEFELTRASVARHNLKYAARRASKLGPQQSQANNVRNNKRSAPGQVTEDRPAAEWMAFGESNAFWLPELDDAINHGNDHDINQAVLKFFFEEHDPSRVKEVENLLQENIGREETLFVELSAQYPEPSLPVAFAIVDAEKKIEECKDWANFDDATPILNGMRRPTGVWALNYSPWQE